jgi:hypothetical protein
MLLARMVIGGMHTYAFPECIAQRDGAAMFLQEITKGFVGKLVDLFAAIERQMVQGVPKLGMELDAAADG